MQLNSIENELVILTKQTIDIFLKSDNPSDVMALYTFYYYTAKWQGTNQPKCTTSYVSTGLKWSETKVRKIKKELITLGLIEDVQRKDESGKILGWFIKLNYIIKKSTLNENHTVEKPQGGKHHRVENEGTNALSTNNLNALNAGNENALSTNNLNALNAGNENALSADIKNIVVYLNECAGTKFRATTSSTQQHIKARINEGFTVDDFKLVIAKKCDEWLGTEWEQYLRPATLFGSKFESYLNQPVKKKKAKGASGVAVNHGEMDEETKRIFGEI